MYNGYPSLYVDKDGLICSKHELSDGRCLIERFSQNYLQLSDEAYASLPREPYSARELRKAYDERTEFAGAANQSIFN